MAAVGRIFASPRVTAMAAIGFASGLPYALTTSTLQNWLRDSNVPIATITFLTAVVGWPYFLKILWAPLLDRYTLPILGRRRGWLLVLQIALVGAIGMLAFVDPRGTASAIAVVGLAVAFFSASQDIVVDAYRADVLRPDERGPGASTFVSGYRVALLLTSAAVLVLVDKGFMSWRSVYLACGGLMSVGIIATLLAPEPDDPGAIPPSLADAIVLPFKDILQRQDGWLILLFVLLFRLPDALVNTVTVPFLRDVGYTMTDIAIWRQFVGGAITIAAALLGGAFVARVGTKRSLWVFGVLQALSNVGFWVLTSHADKGTLIAVLSVESFCGGLVTAGFFVFLMNQCRAEFSATQYALLSSLMAVAGNTVGAYTGKWVVVMGYPAFFLMTVLAALPGMAILPLLFRRPIPVAESARAFPVRPATDTMEK